VKLNDTLLLETAAKYLHPGDPGAILPVVCGDFLTAAVNSSDPEAGGMLPAVLIDVTTWTYCLNNGRSAAQISEIYVEDVKQNPIVYTIDLANNYEGKGLITTVTFNTDPGGRQVAWRGLGLADGTGALITNPITAVEYVFTTYGDWLMGDFDRATVNESRRRCEGHGYTIHWVFGEHRTYKEWLTELMIHYFGDHLLTSVGTLAIALDEVLRVDPSRIMAQLDARTDLVGEAPELSVEWDLDRRNLCNALTVRYQYSWSRGDFTAPDSATHNRSISLYGGKQPKEMLLPGIRTEVHLKAWESLFFARYALLPAMVRFPVKTVRYPSLMPSNYLTLTWRGGPEPTGTGWQNRLLKVLNVNFKTEAHQTDLECLDTGLDYEAATYALLQDASSATWYLSVDEESTFLLSSFNPGINAVNASTWSWIRLVSANSTVYYVRPATAGGVWVVSLTQPAGTGTTAPVVLVSRQSTRWRLAITNTGEVFFLTEPRQLPFGGKVLLTSVIGQFRLGYHQLA